MKFIVSLVVVAALAQFSFGYSFQKVCSGDALPTNAVLFGNTQSMWSPSDSPQYLCIPDGTQFFGRMTDPSDATQPFPGYCFYFNGTTTPNQLAPSTKCSQILISSTPIVFVSVSAGFGVQSNMITVGSSVAARSAPSSTNYGNRVPGYVPQTNGTLGSLIVDDFGLNSLDSFEVALSSAPQNGPLPVAPQTGSQMRIVLGTVTANSVDITITPSNSNVATNLTQYAFARLSPWITINSVQFYVNVYENVQGQRGNLLFKTTGLFYSPYATFALIGSYPPNGMRSFTATAQQPTSQFGSIRIVNLFANSNPVGLKCNGAIIIAENTTYGSASPYANLCGVSPLLSVSVNGAVILNLTTSPATYAFSSVYIQGDALQAFPPVQSSILLDRPLV
eukprot:PhF_6_TR26211/c0_g1_i1/m.37351